MIKKKVKAIIAHLISFAHLVMPVNYAGYSLFFSAPVAFKILCEDKILQEFNQFQREYNFHQEKIRVKLVNMLIKVFFTVII